MRYIIEICLDEDNELYQRLAFIYASQNVAWGYEGRILRNILTGSKEGIPVQVHGALTGLAFFQSQVEKDFNVKFPPKDRIGEVRIDGQTICTIGDKFNIIE